MAFKPAVPSLIAVLAEASRWQECSNAEVARTMSVEEMAKRMVVGSRVARGRDWNLDNHQDGTPPAPGTVIEKEKEIVRVKWDSSGKVGGYFMGGEGNVYRLKLLACAPPEHFEVRAVAEGLHLMLPDPKSKLVCSHYPIRSQVALPAKIQMDTPAVLNLEAVSCSADINTKSKMLAGKELKQVCSAPDSVWRFTPL